MSIKSGLVHVHIILPCIVLVAGGGGGGVGMRWCKHIRHFSLLPLKFLKVQDKKSIINGMYVVKICYFVVKFKGQSIENFVKKSLRFRLFL